MGDTYFKLRELSRMKFKKFVIFSFQITTTTIMIYGLKYSIATSYFPFFIVSITVSYAFLFSYG